MLALAACTAGDGTTAPTESEIINGHLETRFPGAGYLVANGEVFCSAALIEPDLVVTAGHCATRSDSPRFGWGQVTAKTTIAVTSIAIHPRYIEPGTNSGTDTDNSDIALFRLSEPAPIAPLPITTTPGSGAALALGYGSTSYTLDADGSYHPHGAGTDRKSAAVTVSSSNAGEVFTSTEPGSSTCYGDSGSPLLVNGQVAGVLSRFVGTTRCLPEDHPLMSYTRIEGKESFFKHAKECFGSADVTGCLRNPALHLCESPWLTNVASPGNVTITNGDAKDGGSIFTLHAHQEFAVRFQDFGARTTVSLFSGGDARMTVKRVNGGETLGVAASEVTVEPGSAIDVVMRSCNDLEQLLTLVWRPAN